MAQSTPPSSPSVPTARVLLVGVDNYDAFSGTRGGEGAYGLRGSRTDVVLLAWYCHEVLGIPTENIHVLAGPAPTDDELQKHGPLDQLAKLRRENIHEATAKNATDLLSRLLEETKAGGEEVLFAFSGHGAWTDAHGPVLCLGDTSPDLAGGVVPLKALRKLVSDHDARGRVVAILDCCHVAGLEGRDLQTTSLPHGGTAADVRDSDRDFNVSERVILASKPGKPAYQMRLGMHAHGALTFALVTAAERWRASDGMAHGSYKRVLKKTKKLVKALGVPQSPTVLWKNTMNEPFLATKPGPVSRTPDAVGRRVQIDTGWYTFRLHVEQVAYDLCDVYATNATSTSHIKLGTNGTYSPPSVTECWYVNKKNLEKLESGPSSIRAHVKLLRASSAQDPLAVSVMADHNSTAGYSGEAGELNTSSPYIHCHETPASGWSSSAPTANGTVYYFKGETSEGTELWMGLDLHEGVLKQVIWYLVSGEGPGAPLQLKDATNFTYQGTDGPTEAYYQSASKNGN
jgi:hypothetical protein